jgi:hypothetical protein
MASPQTPQKLKSNFYCKTFVHDIADATVITDIGWIDFSLYSRALIGICLVSGANMVAAHIYGNTAADGTGTDVTIATHAAPTDITDPGEQVWMEVTAEQFAQEGADAGYELRGLSAVVDSAHADDIYAVTYILEAKNPHLDLTDDITT